MFLAALFACVALSVGTPMHPSEMLLSCFTHESHVPRLCLPSRDQGPAPLKQACMATLSPSGQFFGDCWEQQEVSMDQCKEHCYMDSGPGAQFCCCYGKNCNNPDKILMV